MSKTPSSVLVLGAGELGSEVLKSLTSHPSLGSTQISLLLRPSTLSSTNPAKRAELQSYTDFGIEFVEGDIADPVTTAEDLSKIFRDFDVVVGCTGMTFPPGTQIKIAQAILLSSASHGGKTKRYFPWQFGIDYDRIGKASAQDLFDEQLEVRGILRSQEEVEWVIVSTGMFISFLFEPAFGVVDLSKGEEKVVALGSWENALTVTAPEDIGRVTAELVLAHPDTKGVVYVAGDTISMTRLGDVVDGLVGKKVERKLKSVEELRKEVDEDGGKDSMKKYRAVFANGVGVSWNRDSSWNVVHGIETITVEEWAKMNLKFTTS